MSITHAKVSAKSDGGDSSLVLPSDWNAGHVISGFNAAFIGAKAYYSTNQSLNDTVILFNTEEFDTDGFHDTGSNTSRMTIPAGLGGKYLLNAGGFANGATRLQFIKNGSTQIRAVGATLTAAGYCQASAVADLAAGDYVEVLPQAGTTRTYGDNSHDGAQMTFAIVKLDSGKVGSGIGAKVFNSTTQSLTASSADQTITFDSEEFDTDGFHSTSSDTSRMTIPAGLGGKYLIAAGGLHSGGTASSLFYFRVNGSTSVKSGLNIGPSNNPTLRIEHTNIIDLAAGDYVEFLCTTNAGAGQTFGHASTINAQAWFSIMRLDSGTAAAPVGAPAYVPVNGFDWTANVTGGNLGANGGTYAAQVFVPARMYLRSVQYRNTDTATARSMEWGLYLDEGAAICNRVAYGTDSFTPSGASNRTSAVSSPAAPVLLSPGVYWLVIRNTGGATNFQVGFVISGDAAVGLIGCQAKTLGSALGATLDLSASWTRTSANIPAWALRGSVFGESTAF